MARLPRYPADARVTGSDLNLILSILDSGGIANSGSATGSGVTGDSLSATTPNLAGSINPIPGGVGTPTTVRGLTGSYGIDNFSQSHTAYVLLSWTPNPVSDFISQYDIYYHKGSDPTLYNLSVSGGVSSARINNLFPGNIYSFSAQARDAANRASQWCPEITVTISLDSDPPAIPTSLTATSTSTGIYLTWIEVGPDGNSEDLKQYQVAVSLDGGATYPITRTTGPGNSYFYTPISANQGTVFFKVASVDWTGNVSDYSSVVSAAVGTILGDLSVSGEIRNTTSANGTPFTQARITAYRDASNWGYVAYGSDGVMRVTYSKTASAQKLSFGTSSAVDNTGVYSETANLSSAGALTLAAGATLTTGDLTLSGAAAKVVANGTGTTVVVPGTVGLNLNNNANNATNLSIPDNGQAVFRNGLALLGGTTDVGAGTMGYAAVTANQTGITTEANLTSLTVTVTAGTGRRLRITGFLPQVDSTVGGDFGVLRIYEDATVIQGALFGLGSNANEYEAIAISIRQPASGSHTYKLTLARSSGTGTFRMVASTTAPAFILVEDIGT